MANQTQIFLLITGLLFSMSVTAQTEKASPAQDKNGARLWADNCGACHNLRSPAGYSDAQWDVAVQHMRLRANLTAKDTKAIVEFLKLAN